MLTFFVIVILVALALQWFSLRNAADHGNIRYECKPSVRACEPGEEFLVLSNVANLGLRPSPALRIEEHFPQNLNVLESEQFNVKWLTKEYRIYYSTVLMHGHQQVKRSLRASIAQRGEYCFSYATFYAGDFLGFREYVYRMENDSRIRSPTSSAAEISKARRKRCVSWDTARRKPQKRLKRSLRFPMRWTTLRGKNSCWRIRSPSADTVIIPARNRCGRSAGSRAPRTTS